MKETHKYHTSEGTVLWQPKLCAHTGICFRGLPLVFDPRRKPWIITDGIDPATIKAQIEKCPSGALSWIEKSQEG